MQRPKWIDVLMLLVRVAVVMSITRLILDGEWRILGIAAFISAWIVFDGVKRWIERLAGVRS